MFWGLALKETADPEHNAFYFQKARGYAQLAKGDGAGAEKSFGEALKRVNGDEERRKDAIENLGDYLKKKLPGAPIAKAWLARFTAEKT